MFTGIVQAMGGLVAAESGSVDTRMTFEVPASLLADARTGDSMAVSGVCLTMLALEATRFSADLSSETLSRTVIGDLQPGAKVNLEPALRVSDRLGGHIVSGHVDGVARLVSRSPDGRSERFGFELPPGLEKYVAGKGSICIDGVSLTVNSVSGGHFDVCIIPHTLEVTTLGALQAGDRVNIEVDLVARYLERMLAGSGEEDAT
jgi:riboflavin synthase